MNDNERYSRQTMLPCIGDEGQRKLLKARVAVIGLGGLGAPAATYLAGAGIGTLVLVDADTVSLSNLQRQVLYSEKEIGMSKAECAARRLNALNSTVATVPFARRLTEQNGEDILHGCDVVVDCTDNYEARYTIDSLCRKLGIPWVYGSIGEFSGQVSIFGYKSGTRYTDLYPDRDALCSLPHSVRGVLGAVPGVIGAIQANEVVKLIAGCEDILDGRLFTIDLMSMETNIFNLGSKPVYKSEK